MFARFFLLPICFFLLSLSCFTACVKKNKESYSIAIDPLWYPLDFLSKENNVMGFSTELLTEIGKKQDMKLSILNTNWDTLFQGLKMKSYNGILSSLLPHNFNKNQYDFSDLYLATGPVLLLPASSTHKSLSDLEGKEVGVIVNSSSIPLLEKYSHILIRTYPNPASLINDLITGQVEAGLLPLLTAESFAGGSFTGLLTIASDPLNDEGLRLLTLKNKAPHLIQDFNEGLKALKKTGTYEKLLKKWQLTQVE